jgi:hypothetical protein
MLLQTHKSPFFVFHGADRTTWRWSQRRFASENDTDYSCQCGHQRLRFAWQIMRPSCRSDIKMEHRGPKPCTVSFSRSLNEQCELPSCRSHLVKHSFQSVVMYECTHRSQKVQDTCPFHGPRAFRDFYRRAPPWTVMWRHLYVQLLLMWKKVRPLLVDTWFQQGGLLVCLYV